MAKEAICLPHTWKVTGVDVGGHNTHAILELESLHTSQVGGLIEWTFYVRPDVNETAENNSQP